MSEITACAEAELGNKQWTLPALQNKMLRNLSLLLSLLISSQM